MTGERVVQRPERVVLARAGRRRRRPTVAWPLGKLLRARPRRTSEGAAVVRMAGAGARKSDLIDPLTSERLDRRAPPPTRTAACQSRSERRPRVATEDEPDEAEVAELGRAVEERSAHGVAPERGRRQRSTRVSKAAIRCGVRFDAAWAGGSPQALRTSSRRLAPGRRRRPGSSAERAPVAQRRRPRTEIVALACPLDCGPDGRRALAQTPDRLLGGLAMIASGSLR